MPRRRLGGRARARVVGAGAIALLCAIGIAALVVHVGSGGGARAENAAPPWLVQRDAIAPFAGYREVTMEIGGRCRRVAVADSLARREAGLRGRDRLGPYAGMLFVYASDTRVEFTMSGVTTPLDIAWYRADGARAGAVHMAPCPHRDQAHCPVYGSRVPYRYALETHPGTAAPTAITACS